MGECSCLLHYKRLYSWCEELLRQLAFHQNTEDLTMKQMFDISEKLVSEQSDEIYGVKTIDW